jgi:uncharacterized protein (DUF305 family)
VDTLSDASVEQEPAMDRKVFVAAVASLALVAAAGVGLAQHQGHGYHGAAPAPAAAGDLSTAAFRAANARMHRDMDIAFTGHADIDFVRGMIPHHEGAIAMAKVVLEHGRDAETRKWAADIIREQEREIGEMRAWLRRNGG